LPFELLQLLLHLLLQPLLHGVEQLGLALLLLLLLDRELLLQVLLLMLLLLLLLLLLHLLLLRALLGGLPVAVPRSTG